MPALDKLELMELWIFLVGRHKDTIQHRQDSLSNRGYAHELKIEIEEMEEAIRYLENILVTFNANEPPSGLDKTYLSLARGLSEEYVDKFIGYLERKILSYQEQLKSSSGNSAMQPSYVEDIETQIYINKKIRDKIAEVGHF